MSETVSVSAEADQQHRPGEPVGRRGPRRAAAPRPPAQQPRHAVLPAPEPERPRRQRRHRSSSAAAPTACPTSRTARPPRTRSSARSATPRRASTRSREVQVLSNSYSAEYGGLAGVVVTTKRGGNKLQRHRLLRLQLQRPERPHLQPEAASGRRARRSELRHPRSTAGAPASAGPSSAARPSSSRTTRARTRRRSTAAAGPTCPPRPCATATSRARSFTIKDPLTGQPFPGNVIPANRLDPSAQKIMNFFYPLPNQGHPLERHRRLPAVRARDPEPQARRPAHRPRGHEERLALPARRATSTATPTPSSSRAATRSRTCRSWTPSSTPPP